MGVDFYVVVPKLGIRIYVGRHISEENSEEFMEKLIVISLSKGKKSLTDIAKELNEPTTTIGRYLPILMEKELVIKESRGSYKLLDNLFGYWVKQKYAAV
ncbi:MAG TPA: hypothetical protein VJH24_00835 [Candidatus Bilamarchaeaceae archaeon]|nr:hypothetical protein [Candidatus Bilamarchaeaceae archaeon]